MDIAILALCFVATIAVAGAVVFAFAPAMDGVLRRLMTGELEEAWSRYAKFALFVAGFTGGLRLKDIEPLIVPGAKTALSGGQCLMEVLKSITGTLATCSEALLLFFGAALAAYAGQRAFGSLQGSLRQPRTEDHRQPAGAGRY